MQITKYGHSCLHVADADASILIDPGTFSKGFESLTGLTAVLITHQHADHVDVDRLGPLLAANPDAGLYADHDGTAELAKAGIAATEVVAGTTLDVGTTVAVHGEWHAVIHTDIPRVTDVGYLIGGRLFHPGDALTVLDAPVEILALPAAAPWMALKEAIEYYRAVAPVTAIPIHEKILASPDMAYGTLDKLGPAGSTWVNLDDGEPVDL